MTLAAEKVAQTSACSSIPCWSSRSAAINPHTVTPEGRATTTSAGPSPWVIRSTTPHRMLVPGGGSRVRRAGDADGDRLDQCPDRPAGAQTQ